MKTLVLGASLNKDRFSNKAIVRLIESGHEVYAIGNRKGEISNVSISTDLLKIKNIHTVTIYLSKKNQVCYKITHSAQCIRIRELCYSI